LLVSSCVGGEPLSAPCDAPRPPLGKLDQVGRISLAGLEPPVVTSVARDVSVTVVGFCQNSSRLPRPAPHLVTSDREIAPVGGELVQFEDGWVNYYYYPVTTADELQVVQGNRDLADISFDGEPPPSACSLRATRPVRLVECGALVIAEWRTPLRTDPERVELMDVDVVDQGSGRMLGFMQEDFDVRQGRLTVRFGFRRPSGSRVKLRLRYLYVEEADLDHPRERVFDPPLQRGFRLRGVG
jgi:hypothetical protein